MDKIYLVTWEAEDSMDHGIHGAYDDAELARHTRDVFDQQENGRNYDVTTTLLSRAEV